ncbi:MAG: tetratricopeptide repeat protein [Desulfosudaceae bacterium]
MKTIFLKIIICLFLVFLTGIVYWQTQAHGPINADDFYLTTNKHMDNAYSYQGLVEGMGTLVAGVWMPLIYLLVGAQMELFGTNFGAYHLVSAGLHAVNAIILFLLLFQMTRATWLSALVAVVFAVHPVNVEPVAWLVGVRVIQCGLFCLLTMYFYALYTARSSSFYYTLSLFCYAASLFSVPMFLPLPFLLLLLDFWPLDRLGVEKNNTAWKNLSLPKIGRAVWEKFPFFGIMVVLMAVLLISHDLPSTSIELYPLGERLANALLSYVRYIQQILLPINLAVFYPFPTTFPAWKIIGSIFILTGITVLGLVSVRRFPFLIVGWLWFAGMLFPLSGIAQIGTQARADHYTYLPMIGLIIPLCWGAASLAQRWRISPGMTAWPAAAVIIALTVLSWRQAGYWKNSVTLFNHSLKVTKNNYEAHNYLAQALASRGDLKTAFYHFDRALAIKPDHLKSHINLANTWMLAGDPVKAREHLSLALRKNPRNAQLHNNLGVLHEKTDNIQAALEHYRRATTLDPGYLNAYLNLAGLEAATGKSDQAITHFQKALRIDPRSAETHFQLGLTLHQTGRTREAADHLERALDLEPGNRRYRQLLKTISRDRPPRGRGN